ncbi:alpha/beta hydrolase [Rhizorhabdus argentea]|uniref:alpha/beta hydrolase n=1 Tax=Rhizorhabdus argentea TaxID=1387174 RepID=UPI0030EF9B52
MPEQVRFLVDGTEVHADLYVPPDMQRGEKRPAIVAGHGFSGVREMLAPQGEFFSKAGYVTLAIDYRSFGTSGGEVRGEVFPERQMDDLSAAISYLQTRDEVEHDRIALWGTSFGGAMVLGAIARDRRARAVIAQVPIVDGRGWMRALRNAEQWETLLDAIDEDRARRFQGHPSLRIPVSLPFSSEEICAMPASQDTLAFQTMMPDTWRGDISLESLEKVLQFSPAATISQISPRPLCIVMNTGYEVIHPIGPVVEAYGKAAEPKKLVLLPYDQLGFYADEGQDAALGAALRFLEEVLPVGSKIGGAVPRSRFAS